jgi:hypothetical protein
MSIIRTTQPKRKLNLSPSTVRVLLSADLDRMLFAEMQNTNGCTASKCEPCHPPPPPPHPNPPNPPNPPPPPPPPQRHDDEAS